MSCERERPDRGLWLRTGTRSLSLAARLGSCNWIGNFIDYRLSDYGVCVLFCYGVLPLFQRSPVVVGLYHWKKRSNRRTLSFGALLLLSSQHRRMKDCAGSAEIPKELLCFGCRASGKEKLGVLSRCQPQRRRRAAGDSGRRS